MTKFDSAAAELHLGILNKRMERLRGRMTACATRLSMDPSKVDGGIDTEAVKAEFDKANEEHKAIELVLAAYEDIVLAKTSLKEPS
jgi:hypothetical protein